MAYHQGKLVQTKARPISTIKPSACEKWSCSKKWLVRCHQLLCCGSHSNVVGMTTGPHAKTHPTKFRYVHTSHPCTHTHTSYILLHHVTQRHGNCLSSSVINYLTRIASDHKWYKWSSQKQLIIRSENVSKLPRWWWRHCAPLPQARNREVEKPIRHPDMCIDRLIHAMKQLHFSLIMFCRISKRTIPRTKVPIANPCDHLIDQWHCDYW